MCSPLTSSSLTSFVLPSIPLLPVSTPPVRSARWRGAQPGNTNALQHGLRSSLSLPFEAAPLFRGVRVTAGLEIDPDSLIPVFHRLLDECSRVLLVYLLLSKRSSSFEESARCLRVTTTLVGLKCRLYRAVIRLQFPDCDLRTLARAALPLTLAEFVERGLRVPRIDSPTSSIEPASSSSPFFTDQQWCLVETVINSLQARLDEDRKYKRRKPTFPVRLLFEAVLLKLAFKLPWRELPGLVSTLHPDLPSLPLRHCCLLYRNLYNSGYLQTIYNRLYRSLLDAGGTTIQELVHQGFFQLGTKSVYRTPGRPLTWQVFTALLFLQRARHYHLAHLRELRDHPTRYGSYPRRFQPARRRSSPSNAVSSPFPASLVGADSPAIPVDAISANFRCIPGHSFEINLTNGLEFGVSTPVSSVHQPCSCHFYDLPPPRGK